MLLTHSWDAMPIIYICWMKQMISTITYVEGFLYGKHFTYIILRLMKGGDGYPYMSMRNQRFSEVNLPNQDHMKPSIWVCTSDHAYLTFKNPVITWPLCTKWMPHIRGPNSVAQYPFLVVSEITFSALWPLFPIHILTSTPSLFRCPNKQPLGHAPCLSSPTFSLSCNCIQLHGPVSDTILTTLSPQGLCSSSGFPKPSLNGPQYLLH